MAARKYVHTSVWAKVENQGYADVSYRTRFTPRYNLIDKISSIQNSVESVGFGAMASLEDKSLLKGR